MRVVFAMLSLASLFGCSSASTTIAPDDGGTDGTTGDGATDTSTGADSVPTDVAPTDGVPSDTATTETRADGGGPVCTDPTSFPKFEKGCGADANCVIGMHTINCCGSQLAIAFNHSLRDAFDAAEKAWQATCPKCGCPAMAPVNESGKTGSSFDARCIGGKCISVAK